MEKIFYFHEKPSEDDWSNLLVIAARRNITSLRKEMELHRPIQLGVYCGGAMGFAWLLNSDTLLDSSPSECNGALSPQLEAWKSYLKQGVISYDALGMNQIDFDTFWNMYVKKAGIFEPAHGNWSKDYTLHRSCYGMYMYLPK